MDIKALYALYERHGMITTDTRNCPPGALFFALKGASFNGNAFAADALSKGCAYAVVDEPDVVPPGDSRYIVTDCVLTTFKELAREHRRRFSIPVVGITGTNGKTTTKELVAAVLGQRFKVMFTQGNFNNDVGVPKTLFTLTSEHEVAIVEMGASHPGDIKALVDYAEPTCGLITNVGKAHLEGFGSFEGVKRTKGELYDYLKATGGLLFLDAGNEHLTAMAESRNMEWVETYGTTDRCEVQGRLDACAPFVTFEWRADGGAWRKVETRLVGSYNLSNLLAAIAVGLHFGVTPELIDSALAGYTPTNNRSQLEDTGRNRLIVDAYNANPTSMAAAIDNFERMEAPRKMAILGDMRELGNASGEEHRRVVELLKKCHFEEVWLVGEEFAATGAPFRMFRSGEAVADALRKEPVSGRFILIKGSNGMHLATLPALL